MLRVGWSAVAAVVAGFVLGASVAARDSILSADFYQGKTLRIVTGSSLGGGFDVEARLLARHIVRHLPGAPRVAVENKPGAGGLLAANLVARGSAPDGLTLGYFTLALPMAQLARNPAVQFDARQFEFIGAPYEDPALCTFSRSSGIVTFEQWRRSPRALRLGSTGPDSMTAVMPAVLLAAFGLPMRVITGYKGTPEIRLAMISGEIDGTCLNMGGTNNAWPTRSGVTVVVRSGRSDLDPKAPLAMSLASTPRQRELIGVIDMLALVSRTYAFPPGTPTDRRDVVRRAFEATMRDPVYVAEARTASIVVEPLTGDAVAAAVGRVLSVPPSLAAALAPPPAR